MCLKHLILVPEHGGALNVAHSMIVTPTQQKMCKPLLAAMPVEGRKTWRHSPEHARPDEAGKPLSDKGISTLRAERKS